MSQLLIAALPHDLAPQIGDLAGYRCVDISVDGTPILQPGALILTPGSSVTIANDGEKLTVTIDAANAKEKR